MTDSKRKKFEKILPRLQKLFPRLGDANAAEAEAARQIMIRLLATVGLDWHDLLALMQGGEQSILDLLTKLFIGDEGLLVKLGLAGATFFHSSSAAFADVVIDGHRNTWPLLGT